MLRSFQHCMGWDGKKKARLTLSGGNYPRVRLIVMGEKGLSEELSQS